MNSHIKLQKSDISERGFFIYQAQTRPGQDRSKAYTM